MVRLYSAMICIILFVNQSLFFCLKNLFDHPLAVNDIKSNFKTTCMILQSIKVSTSTMETYTAPIIVESDLASSVCSVEGMDQSSNSLPKLAIAPVPGRSQSEIQSEFDDINQAWFTTKEDKDSLQGKGNNLLILGVMSHSNDYGYFKSGVDMLGV